MRGSCQHGRCLQGSCLHRRGDRQTTLPAEVFEIFSGVGDRRVAGRERGRRDGCGAPIERLGIAKPSGFFGDDREIIQRAREIWMHRTKLGFLNPGGGPEQFVGSRKIAGDRSAFRLLDKVLGIRFLRHAFSVRRFDP